MIEQISINDSNLKIDKNLKFKKTYESDTYIATYKGNPKIVKLLKDKTALKNKIIKIELLKDRLSGFKEVITADYFITENSKIIGYMMTPINGELIYTPNFENKIDNITFLKNLSYILKRLHELGIVVADICNNIIFNNQIYLIDHDNFSIDGYPVDAKDICLNMYESIIPKFDERFDNYMFNIYTIAALKNIEIPYIYALHQRFPQEFYFQDKEIRKIFDRTMNLKSSYDEELIIDKINSTQDLKKVKTKSF